MQYCWGVGGYLAEIKTQEQEAALDRVLSYSAEYWVGLTDLSQEGEHRSYRLEREDSAQVTLCGLRVTRVWRTRSTHTGPSTSRIMGVDTELRTVWSRWKRLSS